MRYFYFNPTADTLSVLVMGLTCIVLSALLIPARTKPNAKIVHFLVRDLFMVFGLGFLLPIWYVVFLKKESLGTFGLNLFNWPVALGANVILALLLSLIFIKESRAAGKKIHFDSKDVFYILVTGIFEVIFFYSFMRHYFELAFGVIPAIILASLFYSFHHVGFEVQMRGNSKAKEFSKLFFVGLMYASAFRVFNSFLAIYPFFWGVGANYDVLIEKGGKNFPWKNALAVLVLMILAAILVLIFLGNG